MTSWRQPSTRSSAGSSANTTLASPGKGSRLEYCAPGVAPRRKPKALGASRFVQPYVRDPERQHQTQEGRRGLNMCQYTPKCDVGTHRAGTICPVAGSRGAGPAPRYAAISRMSSEVRPVSPHPSASRTTGTGPQGSGAARRSNTASVVVGGIDGADLIGLAIFAAIVGGKDHPVS